MSVGKHRRTNFLRVSLALLAASFIAPLALSCRGSASPLSPTPSSAPSPTPSPAPTPVPTPLPPVPLRVRFPQTVSALEEAYVVVEAPGLPGRDPSATLKATVYPPGWEEPVWESPLELKDADGVYRSREPIHFPLEALPGEWLLEVVVRSRTVVWGNRWVWFSQRPLAFWDLAPLGLRRVSLRVPREFPLVQREGDEISGVLAWEWRGERLELWWTPGPTKPLTWDTAWMVAEATHPVTGGVGISDVQKGVWQGRPGFGFSERWPDGAAKVLLLQGTDYRLYLLRARASGKTDLSPLIRQIWETFRVN